jgi:hypothetical protein
MIKQLVEMKAQRQIAATQTAQTGLQLTAARDQAVQMIGQTEAMQDQLSEMREQRQIMRRQMDAIEARERPIVAIRRIEPDDFANTRTLRPTIMIHNSGRIGAKDVWIDLSYVVGRPTALPDNPSWFIQILYLPSSNDPARAVIEQRQAKRLTQEEFDSVMAEAGGQPLFIVGQGGYTDMDRGRVFPITPFAFQYDPADDRFLSENFLPIEWENAKLEEVEGDKENEDSARDEGGDKRN